MARLLCICMLVLAASLATATGAIGAARGPAGIAAIPTLPSPARLTGSVPLVPVPSRPRPTLGERAVRIAAREIGVPYRYGGSDPSGFDCSGLTRWVYARLGIELPHNAAAQYGSGRPVALAHLAPGDLVFFHGLGHVGLYIGRGRIIHAPQSGERVEIQSLAERSGEVEGARRIA